MYALLDQKLKENPLVNRDTHPVKTIIQENVEEKTLIATVVNNNKRAMLQATVNTWNKLFGKKAPVQIKQSDNTDYYAYHFGQGKYQLQGKVKSNTP